MADFITRVKLKNYKSIAACDVELGALSVLVGPNGSGKSNFLDALRFVTDSLTTSLEHALRERGGIQDVRRRSGGHPTHFGLRLQFSLPSGGTGHYAFRIGAKRTAGFEVQDEECYFYPEDSLAPPEYFLVRGGKVTSSVDVRLPPSQPDRLYLVYAAGLPPFHSVYTALSRMGFYNLNPAQIRELQPSDASEVLVRDGSNLPSVLRQIGRLSEASKERIEEYLAKVVPGIRSADTRTIGPRETIEFRQDVAGSRDPWRFYAASMSDGTLRVLGILVALFQSTDGETSSVPLVGLEEPETALHPAASGLLLDALRDASERTQVLVTSHSPDLLDQATVETETILAVVSDAGRTLIGPVDEAGLRALRERLYTPGELLRMNQLRPDEAKANKVVEQPDLFGTAQT
jgi:predicted ATPase